MGVNVIIKNYYYIFIIGLFIDFIFSGFIVDIIVLEIIEGLKFLSDFGILGNV